MVYLEAPTAGIEKARAAFASGVDRIELFNTADVAKLRGSTPPLSWVDEMVSAGKLGGGNFEVVPVVKPVDGPNFVYSDEQKASIVRDCLAFRDRGCAGVVVGAWVTVEGGMHEVDSTFMAHLVSTLAPMPVTFHHAALDRCDQTMPRALSVLQGCGVARVLSTGRAKDVMAGADTLREMVTLAGRGLAPPVITAATGVNAGNVIDLVKTTGVHQVHASKFDEVAKALGKTPRQTLNPTAKL